MQRATKISLWVILIVGAVLIALYGDASSMLSRVATREVNKFFASLEDVNVTCGEISVSLITGSTAVKNVVFSYRGEPIAADKIPGSDIRVECLEVSQILWALRKDKSLNVSQISVIHPSIELWMDEEHPELSFPAFELDTTKQIKLPFSQFTLKKLLLDGATMKLHSLRTPLDVAVNNCTLSMREMAYDSVFTFNDSLYSFSLESATVSLPDGRSRISTQDVRLQAMGILSVGPTRFANTTTKTKTQHLPAADIQVARMEVGPLSHSLLWDGQALIQAVKVYRPKVELWMDEDRPELCFADNPKAKEPKPLTFPLQRAELRQLAIKHASFKLHSTRTKLDVTADSCSLALSRIAYGTQKLTMDTTYDFSLASAKVVLPDGVMHIDTRDINRHKEGIFSVGKTHIEHATDATRAGKAPGADIRVERIEIGPLAFKKLWDRQILFETARVTRPSVELWMDEEHPEKCFPTFEKKVPSKKTAKQKKKIQEKLPKDESLIRLVALKNAILENASFKLHSTRSQLDVVSDSCSVTLHDLAYDKSFRFNDSRYSLSLAHAAVILPDGSMKMETRDLSHRDEGEIHIGPTRIAHNMPKMALGDRVQEPVTWMDMQLESVTIAPLNPIRKAMNKDYTAENIQAVVANMDIFRDERYSPKTPFRMPQRILMDMSTTFLIKHVDAQIKHINIEFASTSTNIAHMELGGIKAGVDDITNRRGYTMRLSGTCPMGTGSAKAGFELTMNQDCQFAMMMHATHVNTNFLNGFLRPLVGMTSDCQVDTLYTQYTGNSVKADGTFRMIYHDFSMKVHKQDDIPYQIITKLAHTFTHLGNTLVPKSNPPTKHAKPRGYQITWKRNELKPVELYLFGPLIDGVKKTFLPGLYIHLRTKDGETEMLD